MQSYKRSRPLKSVIAATLIALAGVAQANEEQVRKGVDAFLGESAVEAVSKTPYAGLYEVVLKSGDIIYTDDKVDFVVSGDIIDSRTRKSVTQARMQALSAIDFSTLPLNQAIKQVKGNGKRVLATFEDPNCGYCKRLGKDLARMSDVTVYTFLMPMLGDDSVTKSHNIWCAKDKAKAWNDWIVDARVPAAASCDTTAVTKNVELGKKLKISGTPTMFLADGSRIGGYLPAAELERALAAVK